MKKAAFKDTSVKKMPKGFAYLKGDVTPLMEHYVLVLTIRVPCDRKRRIKVWVDQMICINMEDINF